VAVNPACCMAAREFVCCNQVVAVHSRYGVFGGVSSGGRGHENVVHDEEGND
jgi:hypothetical protein